ncbi:tryptophan-rich sensory protein [Yimella sp. cx-51]|nr:tryptophan-rich sensory protein [Yimella sp. cx-51]MBC9955462.1 tryptophan-rich sensory protein [Yimella sp. cx-51]MBD2759532.1 tryptophan-rich sensory protein [Yimella sp. cx-573]QTH37950.1 tryptophan-rich sensory protein [Yimella sp. cx-51]
MTGSARLALVTGATGYVGGQVVQRLLDDGWRVRVLSRSADSARSSDWGNRVVADGAAQAGEVEVVEGDAGSRDDVAEALADVDVAWYLLHSMGDQDGFADAEKEMASTFAQEAKRAGVSRLVYLGGLHPEGELSEHLASRVAVGDALLSSGVPTAALQAGVVIGDGSSSFQMLRHLAERLPGAVAPRWIRNHIQPIAIDDAVHYLVGAADLPPEVNRTFDIGGPEAMQYAEMMDEYAKAVGLRGRLLATAPVTTPGLAARWIGLVTPIKSTLAKPLIGSLQHDTVVHERDLDDYLGQPDGGPTPFADAVRAAVEGQDTRRWLRTIAATSAAVTATAVVGSLGTSPDSAWYRSLSKPSFQPPGWVFPIAWTALYADIAVVSAISLADLAELERTDERRKYVAALATNLALNAAWSQIFFRGHRLTAAQIEAFVLALSSADLVRRSAKISPEKGVALAPYAAWTAFATVLSSALRQMNPRS